MNRETKSVLRSAASIRGRKDAEKIPLLGQSWVESVSVSRSARIPDKDLDLATGRAGEGVQYPTVMIAFSRLLSGGNGLRGETGAVAAPQRPQAAYRVSEPKQRSHQTINKPPSSSSWRQTAGQGCRRISVPLERSFPAGPSRGQASLQPHVGAFRALLSETAPFWRAQSQGAACSAILIPGQLVVHGDTLHERRLCQGAGARENGGPTQKLRQTNQEQFRTCTCKIRTVKVFCDQKNMILLPAFNSILEVL